MTPLEAEARKIARAHADLESQIQLWTDTDETIDWRAAMTAIRASLAEMRTRLIEAEKISTENVTAFPGLDGEPQTLVLDGPGVR